MRCGVWSPRNPRFLPLPLEIPPPQLPSCPADSSSSRKLRQGERAAPGSDLGPSRFSVMAGRGTSPTTSSSISSRRGSSSSTESECPWGPCASPWDHSHSPLSERSSPGQSSPYNLGNEPFRTLWLPNPFLFIFLYLLQVLCCTNPSVFAVVISA